MIITLNITQMAILYLFLAIGIFLFCRKRNESTARFILFAAATGYLLLLLQCTLLPVRTGSLYPYISFTAEEIRNIQPIPFTTISLFAGTAYWRVQIFGNILLLAPVPVFLGLIRPDMNGKKLFFTGLLSSVSIEALQLLENMAARYPNRVVDIDDVFLNTAGVLLGVIGLLFFRKIRGAGTSAEKTGTEPEPRVEKQHGGGYNRNISESR